MNLKKNLKKTIEANQDKTFYFFDESRFGTHSNLSHGWFRKGIRTAAKIRLGFQNFYLYTALDPRTGEDFTLMLPNVNTACMNLFLKEMARELKGSQIIIIMDGAGWHHSRDLKIPTNIEIIYLPPYSPELNPVERLWQHIKSNTIKNKIYETIDELEEVVCDFVKAHDKNTIKSICAFNY